MSIRVKIARQPAEIREILATRHHVFVEEDGYMPPLGGYIVDSFDAFPSTVNLVALDGTVVIGGIRITPDGPVGMASDKFFNFREHLPENARPLSCGMLCLRKAYRGNLKLLSGLLQMAAYWSNANGCTHVCAPVNPLVTPVLRRIGFKIVGGQFTDNSGLPTVPMILDISRMNSKFMDFVRRQGTGDWIESFEHEFYAEGEEIIRKGEHGTRAYLLIDGEVEVLSSDGKGTKLPGARIEQGSIFGELSLLNDAARSSTVIASEPTEVMVIDRESFLSQLSSQPEMAISLLRLVGNRFLDTLQAQETVLNS